MTRLNTSTATAFAAAVLLLTMMSGCSKPEDSTPPAMQQQSNDLQGIISRSGGDWNKLTDADKNNLVNNIAHGDVPTAKTLLTMNMPRNFPKHRPSMPKPPGQ